MGFNCFKATEPLGGDSLLFSTEFPGIPGTYLIDLERMKSFVDLETTQGFRIKDSGLEIQHPSH